MTSIRFPTLSPAMRKFLLTLHVGCSVSWVGVSATMTVLSLVGLWTDDAELSHAAYAFMHIFDLALVIPLMLVAVISGVLLSLGTPWGLFQYWWIVIKSLITASIVGFATVQENFWVRGLAEHTGLEKVPGSLDLYLAVCMICFLVALWTATILSIYKPWGRTRWGEARHLQRKAQAQQARK